MKLIIVTGKHGESKTLSLGRWTRMMLSLCLLGAPLGFGGYLGYNAATADGSDLDYHTMLLLKEQLLQEQQQVAETKHHTEQQLQALALRMAQLQARLVRLDALGERITGVAKLDKGEFDFSQPPAVGGPEASADEQAPTPDVLATLNQLTDRLDDREQQLEILETLLANRKIKDDIFLAGRPIKKGWMSSHFGHRNDPFTGRVAKHEGVDFAGKLGSDIIAVASGVVTWSGKRYGYGQLVEINHGGGYLTRYAHNLENKVKVGDIVKKGQVIALMGSSGRSTGPHVHFEVYKHGRVVDPATYIHRASR
jgi:murein DD-endopeptidase MepM/ murein hydrolase activator NlpD